MRMRLNFYKQPFRLKVGNHSFARFITIHTLIFAAKLIDCRVIVQYLNYFKPVTFTDLKVVGVMSRCNFNTARTEILIDIFIGNNGYFSADKRQNKSFAYNIFISLIFGIYGNGSITQKRFGTCGRNNHKFVRILYRIFYMPEIALLLCMFNLLV